MRSKGIKKAKIHALLNCIALIARTIAVNLRKSLNVAELLSKNSDEIKEKVLHL